ncbi:MAG: MarR family transcriptional regulator [bacterium]
MLTLQDFPKYEAIHAMVRRYSDIEPAAVEVFLVLLRLSRDLMAAGETHLARHGMSVGRFTVLMLLNREPDIGVSPSQLADRSGVTRATMTGLLDGLERDGFITREHDSDDRRGMTVRLTPASQEFFDRMLPDHFRRIEAVTANLSENEKKNLIRLLAKVDAGISALRDP